MDEIVVGIDVGTTKICTLVGRVEDAKTIRILGVGIEPSDGIRKGIIVDLAAASQAITRSVEKAERTSGPGDYNRAGQPGGCACFIGEQPRRHGHPRLGSSMRSMWPTHSNRLRRLPFRMTARSSMSSSAASPWMDRKACAPRSACTASSWKWKHTSSLPPPQPWITCVSVWARRALQIQQFVLNPLASAEVVLTEQERQMGVAVCDIGGGTTDLAIYVNGDVWHTMVLAVGGNHITQDIAHGLRLPLSQAEDVKKQQGYAVRSEVGAEEYFSIRPFGEDQDVQINRQDLAHIIEARIEETFRLIMQEIKRSGYDGLLPAGMVLTGGTSALPGIKRIASRSAGNACAHGTAGKFDGPCG